MRLDLIFQQGQTVTKDEALKPDLNMNETIGLMDLYYLTEEKRD